MADLLTGLLGGDNPEPRYADLDQTTKDIMQGGIDRAMRSNAQQAAITNEGVDQRTAQLGASGTGAAQDQARLGGDPAMNEALRNKYNSYANKQVDRLKSQAATNAPMQRAQQLRQMAAAAQGQEQARAQFYQQLTNAYNDQEAQRAEFISQLFQTGTQAYMYSQGGGGMSGMGRKQKQPRQRQGVNNDFNIPDMNDGRIRSGGYAPSQNNYGFDPADYA